MSLFRTSPHLARLLRPTAPVSAIQTATRGGHWHRPDAKPYAKYNYTRRYHLEDINTVLYSDYAPEYHLHLHSVNIRSSKEGVLLIFAYFSLIIMPVWMIARWLHKLAGSMLVPCVRPGPDHAHMAPSVIGHLQNNNLENAKDFLGRQNAVFYKNWCRQVTNDPNHKPDVVAALSKHGFNY